MIGLVIGGESAERPVSRRPGRPGVAGPTERELQVARLSAAGLSRGQIAERLHVSVPTVKRHLENVRGKLGVENPRDREELRRRLADLEVSGGFSGGAGDGTGE